MGISQSFVTEFDATPKQFLSFNRNITADSVKETVRLMAQHKVPTMDDFCWMLREATKRFTQMKNHIDVEVQPTDRVIFVGDIHGCFETVSRLFLGNEETGLAPVGFPGDIVDGYRNVFLFNGDFVDRGGSGYQVVFALAMMSVVFPQCTYLNRGNHETLMFGFARPALNPTQSIGGYKYLTEVDEKFPGVDYTVYQPVVQAFFTSLPVCHSFDKNIFVVHGGVPMCDDYSQVPQTYQPSPFMQAKPMINDNAQPYSIKQLDQLSPQRMDTLDFEDQPHSKATTWHQFLWSYDRLPYAAKFLEFNGKKVMVCSHTATPFHFITTFTQSEENKGWEIQSVANSKERFEQLKEFMLQNPVLVQNKLSIMEIFSSPTNSGGVYCSIVKGKEGPEGQRLDFDPYLWEYKLLGSNTEFKFVQPEEAHSKPVSE